MIPPFILELSQFLLGKASDLPKAKPEILAKFELLKSPPPSYVYANNPPTQDKINLVGWSIKNRLLITKEGENLITDLVILQKEMYTIQFHFGYMPINVLTGKPRGAAGYTDILTDNDDIKDDIKVYVAYESDQKAGDPKKEEVEENFNIYNKVVTGSSRMALNIFHELLHVWFFRTGFHSMQDPLRSGHTAAPTEMATEYDERFISRIRRFRNEIIELEKVLRKR